MLPGKSISLEEWHFVLLGLNFRPDEGMVRAAYRQQMREHHPDKNNASTESTKRSKMINEAKELILDTTKRTEFEINIQSYKPLGVGLDVGLNDIVFLKPIHQTNNHFIYGRVVALDATSYTVAPQNMRRQFELDSPSSLLRLKIPRYSHRSSSMPNPCIRREYGEHERQRANDQWASYFQENDVVTVDNVKEAPWFNGARAVITSYNRDLMRFQVRIDGLGGRVLAFLPHNIKKSAVTLANTEKDPESDKIIGDRNMEIDRLNAYIDRIKQEHRVEILEQSAVCALEFKPSVGESVEVRYDNGTDRGLGVRKTTWHVGVITSVSDSDGSEATYDIQMKAWSFGHSGVMRDVAIVDIKAKRKCGKRTAAEISV